MYRGSRYAPPSTRATLALWAVLILASWALVSAVMYVMWRLWLFVGVGL